MRHVIVVDTFHVLTQRRQLLAGRYRPVGWNQCIGGTVVDTERGMDVLKKYIGEIRSSASTGTLSSSSPRVCPDHWRMASKFFCSSPLIGAYSTAALTSPVTVRTRIA